MDEPRAEHASRILITGAAGGIGGAATAELERRGATVVGLDLKGGDGIIGCDVCDQASVFAAVAEATERLGGLDVLINNAGIGDATDAGAPPDERAERIIDVNLIGPWRVTGAAMPALLDDGGGRVINVASGLAELSLPFASAYAMSKRGLAAYSDVLRLEYGPRIKVTTVLPGYIKTSIHDDAAAQGMSLSGVVPSEGVEAVAATIARAALARRPPRDAGSSRRLDIQLRLLRHVPRRWIDRAVSRQVRRQAGKGRFEESELGRALAERLR